MPPEIELYDATVASCRIKSWEIQFNPTLLDEKKNGDLMWTARYVVRDFILNPA